MPNPIQQRRQQGERIRRALRQSAVGLWTFEASGNLGLDTSGQGNHLTNNNSVAQQVPGKVGNGSVYVAASTQYLSLADNASLSMGAGVNFTLMGWANFAALSAKYAVLSKSTAANVDTVSGANSEYVLYRYSDNKLYFLVGDGAAISQPASAALNATQWYFVACRRDGVNVGLRIDGGAWTNVATTRFAQDGAGPFCIGGISATGGNTMGGQLDNWLVCKRACTDAEVDWYYNGGNGRQL